MRQLLPFMVMAVPAIASAQEAAGSDFANSQYASFLPLIFIFCIFYFLLIRPQQKKMREHQSMLTELQKGDEVVTGGGILGKITRVEADDKVVVEIAKGVEVRVLKSTIGSVLNKPGAIVTTEKKKNTSSKNNDNSVPSRENIANDN